MPTFSLAKVDPSWQPLLQHALAQLDSSYIQTLLADNSWLPGPQKLFNAFSLPLSQTRFILFGESPYPRPQSANGYAFWDNAVTSLWSEQGLSKTVNRATSLRNMIKMLLVADQQLDPSDVSQASIARLDKRPFVQTAAELFKNFLTAGFLLLNATPVLSQGGVKYDANKWQNFLIALLQQLAPFDVQLVLFGQIAARINTLPVPKFPKLIAEHPYNLSFITNPEIIGFFKPLHLLEAKDD